MIVPWIAAGVLAYLGIGFLLCLLFLAVNGGTHDRDSDAIAIGLVLVWPLLAPLLVAVVAGFGLLLLAKKVTGHDY